MGPAASSVDRRRTPGGGTPAKRTRRPSAGGIEANPPATAGGDADKAYDARSGTHEVTVRDGTVAPCCLEPTVATEAGGGECREEDVTLVMPVTDVSPAAQSAEQDHALRPPRSPRRRARRRAPGPWPSAIRPAEWPPKCGCSAPSPPHQPPMPGTRRPAAAPIPGHLARSPRWPLLVRAVSPRGPPRELPSPAPLASRDQGQSAMELSSRAPRKSRATTALSCPQADGPYRSTLTVVPMIDRSTQVELLVSVVSTK